MLHKMFFSAAVAAAMLALTGCSLFQSAYPGTFPAEWKEKEMISIESEYVTIKRNAGADQENIKFPEKYREQLNTIFCNCISNKELLSFIHDNRLEV